MNKYLILTASIFCGLAVIFVMVLNFDYGVEAVGFGLAIAMIGACVFAWEWVSENKNPN